MMVMATTTTTTAKKIATEKETHFQFARGCLIAFTITVYRKIGKFQNYVCERL